MWVRVMGMGMGSRNGSGVVHVSLYQKSYVLIVARMSGTQAPVTANTRESVPLMSAGGDL